MAEDIAQLGIQILSGDIVKATKRLDKLEKQSKKSERTNKKLGNSFGALKSIVTLFAGSLAIKKFVDTAGAFESMAISLEVVTGSADKAVMAMSGITEFAKNTPFQVQEITAAFIKLKALGIEPTEEKLRSFGDTSSAMGKSLNQMIEAVADAATGEFERLKEFGIKARSQGEDVTFTFQGVAKTVGKNSKEITEYLEDIGKTQFAGAMSKQMDTINGKISNLGDSFDNLIVIFSKSGGGEGTKGALDLAIDGVNVLTEGVQMLPGLFVSLFGEVDKFFTNFKAGAEEVQASIAVLWTNKEANQARFALIEETRVAEIAAIDSTVAAFIEGEQLKNNAKPGGGIDEAGKEKAKQQSIMDIKLEYDEADLERLEEKYATEQELLRAKYEEENAILAEKLAVDADFQMEYDRLTLASRKQRSADELALEKKTQASKLKLKLSEARMAGAIADKLGVLMLSKNKEMFEIGKAAATASALINTYEGATKALAQGGFWGIFMAAAVVAAGIAQVSNIQSQQFGGGGGGGGSMSMPSTSMGGGSVPDSRGLSDVSGIEPETQPASRELRIVVEGDGPHSEGMRKFAENLAETIKDMGGVGKLVIS